MYVKRYVFYISCREIVRVYRNRWVLCLVNVKCAKLLVITTSSVPSGLYNSNLCFTVTFEKDSHIRSLFFLIVFGMKFASQFTSILTSRRTCFDVMKDISVGWKCIEIVCSWVFTPGSIGGVYSTPILPICFWGYKKGSTHSMASALSLHFLTVWSEIMEAERKYCDLVTFIRNCTSL